MDPIITTSRYLQTPEEFVKLYRGELVRQHWLLLILFPGIFVGYIIHAFRIGLLGQGFLALALLLTLIFIARYHFISGIKKNPAFHFRRRLKVFADKFLIEQENGSQNVFPFEEIDRVKSRRTNYYLKLKSGNMYWIPKTAFRNEADRSLFERMVVVKK